VPHIKCIACGQDIYIDPFARPYNGELACPNCGEHMVIRDDYPKGGITVTRAFPSLEELKPVMDLLTPLEKSRLLEASRCLGVGADTACESMCFDALVSILRRIYGGKGELGHYISKMEQDPDLSEETGFISSFKAIRNKVDHPVRISKKLDAESTFSTTKRLILIIAKKKLSKITRKSKA